LWSFVLGGGIIIAKKQARPLNPIQFNALAIVLILVGMPFAIAFITNAGSSSDGEYEDSIRYPNPGYNWNTFSYWWDNGGDNFSSYYNDTNTFIENGCNALGPNCLAPPHGSPSYPLSISQTLLGSTPMNSMNAQQTHYGSVPLHGQSYVGSSGNGPFTWDLGNGYFSALAQTNETVDKMRFTMIDQSVDHNCASSIFENITFDGWISFYYDNKTTKFDDFSFEMDNKLSYNSRDLQHGYVDVCHIGFQIVFDFTGFETLKIAELNQGDWEGTRIRFSLNNFKNELGQDITDEALPFAGVGTFAFGVEHQPVNPVEAGFIIKTATIILSLITFALAIASTAYWDPFRNAFKGALD
jgi:hypothetical protein